MPAQMGAVLVLVLVSRRRYFEWKPDSILPGGRSKSMNTFRSYLNTPQECLELPGYVGDV